MTDLRCPACRHPVDVPDDHFESTIRCGICWAEVSLGDRMVPVALSVAEIETPEEPVPEPVKLAPAVAVNADVFAGIPGFAVKGHAPLEEILRRVVQRVPAFLATTAKPAKAEPSVIPADLMAKLPAVPAPVPALPAIQSHTARPDVRRDDDDIRRPRRAAVAKRLPEPDEDSDDRETDDETAPAKSRIGAQIAILGGLMFIAVLAFFVVVQLLK